MLKQGPPRWKASSAGWRGPVRAQAAWEQSYRALQDEAQAALAALPLARSASAARGEAVTIEP